jgi:hypothetical protein
MVASNASALVPNRVVNLEYSHDWLANMTEWTDDAHVFSEDLARDNPNGDRVRALFRAWRQRKLGDA